LREKRIKNEKEDEEIGIDGSRVGGRRRKGFGSLRRGSLVGVCKKN